MFVAPAGDHYRTRLTHTLEVSALARTVARALGLNEDLVEAIAMGHDLGHAPFGHAGEAALDELLRDRHGRRFEHNVQSLRVVHVIERDGRGLNLTRRGARRDPPPHGPGLPATLEGQMVRLMDRVAYVNHDIDDALRAGVLAPPDLPARGAGAGGDDLAPPDRAGRRRGRGEPRRRRGPPVAQLGAAFLRLRAFMFRRVYLAPPASLEAERAGGVVRALFTHLHACSSARDHLAASGVRGVGMMFRPVAVMVVVIVVAASNQEVGLAAGAVYALGVHARARPLAPHLLRESGPPMSRLFVLATTLVLAFPTAALASTVEGEEEKFDPSEEWLLHDWMPIHIGPLDLSINKAVAYLILGSVLTILLGWFLIMRHEPGSPPDRRRVGLRSARRPR